jgi:hypothetical protein
MFERTAITGRKDSMLEKMREEDRQIREAGSRERHQQLLEMKKLREQKETLVMPFVKPATPLEYSKWITGFIRQGGKPEHFYDYPIPRDFYIAWHNLTLPPLYGAMSINIIVPENVTVSYGDIGHSGLFFMDGFRHVGSVPVFSDTVELEAKDE